jgi:hypothetical protein
MKFITGLLFVFIAFTVRAQSLEKVTKTFSVPDGWKSRVVKDTAYFPSFGRRHMAIWEFKCNDDRTQSVWFYVFKYKQADSMNLQQKAIIYYTMSNCLLTANDNINENFLSFNKGDYFFVERMCPCYTKGDPNCRKLAEALLNWIKGNGETVNTEK